MKNKLKGMVVCIVGFIFGVLISLLVIDDTRNESSHSPSYVIDLDLANFNAQFEQYLGTKNSQKVTVHLINEIITSNMVENDKLKNEEKKIIYVSSKGTVKKLGSGNLFFEQSIERNKIFSTEDLTELRNLIGVKDRIYCISVVDYYEEGYIKEILIEAKEK